MKRPCGIKNASLTLKNGETIEAPAVLYRDPGGSITNMPNGAPVSFLNASAGDELLEGPVYFSPRGGLSNTPNGAPAFSLAQSIQPFDVDKIVFLGASITDQSVATQSTRSFIESYVSSVYGKTISVVERATAGWDVSDLRNNIDTIIAGFDAEPNTHYVMHIGGNDVISGTQFLDLSPAAQAQKIADLEYIYDAVHAQGRKLIQSSLTFRNYSGTTIDNDPTTKVNELNGSYTYVRDWIVPVMQSKAPEYLANGWPMIDLYNATRNIYQDWPDGADAIHPNKWARIVFVMEMVDKFMALSEGIKPQAVTPYNFNDSVVAGTVEQITCGFTKNSGITVGNEFNINWNIRNFVGSAGQAVHLENLIDLNGDATTHNLYSFVSQGSSGTGGNTADPTNTSASLLNNTLLSSTNNISPSAGAVIYAMVDGFEPFKSYTISEVSAEGAGVTELNTVHLHNGTGVSVDIKTSTPESNILTNVAQADYMGRLFIAVAEDSTGNTPAINGIQFNSGA